MPNSRPVRIAMWSGPRNISTAMMRAWGNRPDTFVCDEPFYAHYLQATAREHPGAAAGETTMKIDAVTPLRAGSDALLDVARFMQGLMRDPMVSRRFQLRTWEIRPPVAAGPEGVALLNITITLAEKPQ